MNKLHQYSYLYKIKNKYDTSIMLKNGEYVKFVIIFSFVVSCFYALGVPPCRNSIIRLYPQVNSASNESKRDRVALNRVSQNLRQQYKKDPDQFMNNFREKINSEDVLERIKVLSVIRYMKKPPLSILLLIMEQIEDAHYSVQEVAYRTLMSFEITEPSILQNLESRSQKAGAVEKIWIREVLRIQEAKKRHRSKTIP